jgi:hypothetical protein
MSIVIRILDKGLAELGDRGRHKLAYDATEIGGHEKTFKMRNRFGLKLEIDE